MGTKFDCVTRLKLVAANLHPFLDKGVETNSWERTAGEWRRFQETVLESAAVNLTAIPPQSSFLLSSELKWFNEAWMKKYVIILVYY